LLSVAPSPVVAQSSGPAATSPAGLVNLSLEELFNLEVTSVSRHQEKLSDAAAAIYVVTPDAMERAGATTLPEALRLAPGLEVARLNATDWAVSSRGFNDFFANKLQVLVDGRSIYSPLFSGVLWDEQQPLPLDLDRIEVIRGPGASLWGANAVNGVINIISKPAKETQGLLLTGGAGSEDRALVGVRYGVALSEAAHARVYGQYLDRDNSVLANGSEALDGGWMARGGFRTDWQVSEENLLTFQGDAYGGRIHEAPVVGSYSPPYNQIVPGEYELLGGNLLGRWTHRFGAESELAVQAYYDHTERDASALLVEQRDTVDVDVQHRFAPGERHSLTWGVGYRASADDTVATFTTSLSPSARTTHLFSSFVQDEIILAPDRLRLTLGTKVEHNDFTGVEVQPNVRLSWKPAARHTLWASIARAVRTPSRAEDDIRINQQVLPPGVVDPTSPAVVSLFGNRGYESEELIAFEMGYRVQLGERFSFRAAGFYNLYDHLRTLEPTGVFFEPQPVPHLVVGATAMNLAFGETYGGEVIADYRLADWWRLEGQYGYLQIQLHQEAGSLDPDARNAEGSSPHHQFKLRSSMDLPHNLFLDAGLRYVDNLPALGVPSYVTADVRLAWRPTKSLEISIVGKDLLQARHTEFTSSLFRTQAAAIERSVFGRITWHY
jgi:iron complex outermembrane receptor protein